LQNSKTKAKAMITQQLSPYNYPSHVLFQFIIAAFLKTLPAAKRVNEISLQTEFSFPELLLATEELAGQSSPFHTHFSWTPLHGLLSALKNHCILFEKTFSREFPEAFLIKKHATKSWWYSTEMRDMASHLLREHTPHTFAHFQKTQMQMARTLKTLGSVLSKLILRFKNDENVILCLLQRQKELDAFYGQNYTKKIFIKMYKNLDTAQCLLVDAYSRRKFNELIPEISGCINSLKHDP
jgi:hypothetical protein